LAFDHRAKDVVRKAKAKKRRPDHLALSLAKGFEEFWKDERVNVEEHVINRVFVDQLIADDIFNEDELRYIQTLYYNHDASYLELATLLDKVHHESIRRIEKRIAKKITAIKDFV